MSRAGRAERAESAVQVGLMLAVGGLAGAGAFSRVVDLAVAHGQPTWLAVADAAVIETMAVSAGLEIRRRRRTGQPVRFVAAVLVVAVALSLAAQVAQAERSAWGWTMAAVPALGFLVLAKIALSRGPVPAAVPAGPPVPVRVPLAPAGPAAGPVAALRVHEPRPAGQVAAAVEPPAPVAPVEQDQPDRHEEQQQDRDPLLPLARAIAAEHSEREGRPLTRAALLHALRERGQGIGTTRATELLAQLRADRTSSPEGDRP